MSLSHFDPLANLRAFEDAFSRMLSEPQTNRPWAPAVDIYETENELVLKADLPDVDQKDIDVRVENQTLTIAGERKFEGQDGNGKGLSPHRAQLRQFRPQLRRAARPSTPRRSPPRSRTACSPSRFPRRKPPSRARSKSKCKRR